MIQFGTGGWRAIIGDGFTKLNVQLLARGLAKKMKDEGECGEKGICIGYDRRFLSVQAAQWAAEIFAFEGIQCFIVHKEAPTPLIMFAVKDMDLCYGIAVTASHNPAIYNGVKVFTAGGRDADEIVTRDLERYISEFADFPIECMSYEEGLADGIIEIINPGNSYIDSIISSVDMQSIRNRGLTVALDPMYGVSQTSLKTILMTARCEVSIIHERHDTLFGGRLPTPNVDTLKSLINHVVENKCDLGIATDGDADRLGIINDRGEFLHPNVILTILYYYLLAEKGWTGPAVRNIATTHMLDRVARHFGEMCYEVPVGFKHVSSKMRETNAVIGGESSGGLTVRGHISGKDGIYAATLLVEMIAVTKKSLSQIYDEICEKFGKLYMEERDYLLTREKKDEIREMVFVDKLLPVFPHEILNVSYLDGVKIYFKNGGWIIARCSGTEPLLRIFCEMDSENEAKQMCDIFKQFLKID